MTRQIPAVHGRDILRHERFQSARVVPVEEVAAKPWKLGKRLESQLKSFDELKCSDVAEVVRRDCRKQKQTDVGRRGAVRDDGLRVFLKIVRRQPLIFLADEGLEESPRAARDQMRHLLVY